MPPKPCLRRLPQRKAVTIISGFNCIDGIVICADTEELVADRISRTSTDKHKTVQLNVDGGWMIFGGAGESGVMECTVAKFAGQQCGRFDCSELEDELDRLARELLRR